VAAGGARHTRGPLPPAPSGTSLSAIIDIIVPIFGLMAFGYGATFTRVFDAAAAQALAAFVFYFAIPIMLFRSMAAATLPDQIPWGYLLSYYLGVAAVFGAGMGLAGAWFGGSFERRAITGFGAAFGNTVLLGIPLVLTSFGEVASLPLFLMLAFHSTLLFTAITVVIEVGRGSREGLRELPLKVAAGLASNPVLWGLLGGIAFNLAGLSLPGTLERFAALIGGAAVPCALFSVGASLRAYRLKGALPPAALMVALKLVAQPLIVWALVTFVFAVPPLWGKVAVLLAALPVGVNVYLFAVRYDAGQAESASAILLSSVLSVATLALVLLWLGPA
jgi:malonate transporter and related proteins